MASYRYIQLVNFVWILALAIYILAGVPLVPFHGDESTLIYMSRDYDYVFIQHDLALVRYSDTPSSPTEQQLRLLNGTIHKNLIGLARQLRGITTTNEQWDWGADWDYNQSTGHAPNRDLLLTGRWVSAFFLAGGVVIMFILGKELGGRPVAYLASLYYTLNPALLLNGRRAMQEGSMIFFGLLVVLAGIWLLKKQTWWMAALLGIAAGLALASKHTNAFTVAAVFGAIGLYTMIGFGRAKILSIVYLIIAALITITLFYTLNPVWCGDPIARAGTVLNERTALLDLQVNIFGGYANFADQLAGFGRQALIVRPQYYEVETWAGYIGDQIQHYESSLLRGMSIAGSLPGAIFLCGLILLGVWAVLRDKHIPQETRFVIGIWAVFILLTTALLTPLEWQRYYLTAYPAVGLLASLGTLRLFAFFAPLRLKKLSQHQQSIR